MKKILILLIYLLSIISPSIKYKDNNFEILKYNCSIEKINKNTFIYANTVKEVNTLLNVFYNTNNKTYLFNKGREIIGIFFNDNKSIPTVLYGGQSISSQQLLKYMQRKRTSARLIGTNFGFTYSNQWEEETNWVEEEVLYDEIPYIFANPTLIITVSEYSKVLHAQYEGYHYYCLLSNLSIDTYHSIYSIDELIYNVSGTGADIELFDYQPKSKPLDYVYTTSLTSTVGYSNNEGFYTSIEANYEISVAVSEVVITDQSSRALDYMQVTTDLTVGTDYSEGTIECNHFSIWRKPNEGYSFDTTVTMDIATNNILYYDFWDKEVLVTNRTSL